MTMVRCWKCKTMVRLTSAYYIHPVTRRKVERPWCQGCYERAVHRSTAHPEWDEEEEVLRDDREEMFDRVMKREMDKSSRDE